MVVHRSTPLLPYASPRDQHHGPRWALDDGGPPQRGRFVRTNAPAPNWNSKIDNLQVWRTRGPYFTIGNVIPLADPVRQSEQGPERPRMHMATGSFRKWMGTDRTRFSGDHTWMDAQFADSLKGGASKKGGMRSARLDRLTAQMYRGQTYSQTTRLLGGNRG